MKGAISNLESTVITIGIMLLKEVVTDDNEALNDDLENLLHSTRNSLDGKDGSPEFASSWSAFCTKLDDMKLREKIDITVSKRKENKTFQYLMGFVRLVKRLFTFIEAVRSRNWDLYLSSFEAMVKDFTSFDRIKYRRWSAVYLTDMFSLKDRDDLEDRKVWQAFSNGDFSCQRSVIPGTAIGRDHCGHALFRENW